VETPPRTGRRAIALGLGGASVASLAAGIALGVQAQNRRRDAASLCPDPAMCIDPATANALASSARTRAIGADVAFAAAGGRAIAAGLVWGASPAAITPTLAPDRVGLTAVTRW